MPIAESPAAADSQAAAGTKRRCMMSASAADQSIEVSSDPCPSAINPPMAKSPPMRGATSMRLLPALRATVSAMPVAHCARAGISPMMTAIAWWAGTSTTACATVIRPNQMMTGAATSKGTKRSTTGRIPVVQSSSVTRPLSTE